MRIYGTALILLAACSPSQAQTRTTAGLEQFSDGVRALANRVSPSVVKISVTRFGQQDEAQAGSAGAVLGRERVVGSGVIVDPEGYIVTNAHVVNNAVRIQVSGIRRSPAKDDQVISDALAQAIAPAEEATLVGVFKELDLAVIKIPEHNLPTLHFADYHKLRQGDLVFAFGNREGLGNSMSMGVVSSVARQPDPDSPFLYIQTDAAINRGDSGGPLVNASGEVVGVDTFILTQSGGSEGIGFAIPSTLAEIAYQQMRKYGHVHKEVIGAGVQSITPTLAKALSLPRDAGVLVSDVTPGSPAEKAGVKINDVLLALNDRPVANVPMFSTMLLQVASGSQIKLELLRGTQSLSLNVTPEEQHYGADHLADLIDPENNRIRQLGIVGLPIDDRIKDLVDELRGPYGVIVAALSASSVSSSTGLQVGDVIHEVNGTAVPTIDALRGAMDKFKRGDAVALFIERDGKLQYLSFEVE